MTRTHEKPRTPWLPGTGGLPVVAAGLLLFGGCAARQAPPAMSLEPPESPAAARAELFELEQRIARSRQQLGLPDPGAPAQSASPEAPGEAVDAAPRLDAAPRAAPSAAEAADAAPWEPPDPCRHARAICQAAERICQIADYLADDDARTRCQRARQACERARQRTGCD